MSNKDLRRATDQEDVNTEIRKIIVHCSCCCSLFLLLFIVLVTVYCSGHFVHCSCHYSFATLTEVFPYFFLSCKANARV
jgi:hypothetical protein